MAEIDTSDKMWHSMDYLEALFIKTNDIILLTNDKGHYIKVNPAATRLLGYSEEELLKMSIPDLVMDDDSRKRVDELWGYFRMTGVQTGFIQLKRKDGQAINCQYDAIENIVEGVHMSILRNVNRSTKVASLVNHFDLVKELPIAVCLCDYSGNILLFNESAEILWGRKLDPGENVSMLILHEGKEPPLDENPITAAMKAGQPLRGEEFIVKRPGGEIRNVIPYPVPVRHTNGEVTGCITVLADITDRKNAEEKIRISQQMLLQSQRLAGVGGWEWNIKSNKVSWTDELFRIFEYEPGGIDLTFETVLARAHPDDRPMIENLVEQLLRTRQPIQFNHRIIRPDGSVRTLHTEGEVVTDADNQPVIVRGVSIDVTEKLKAEEEITKLSIIARKTSNAVIIINSLGRIDWVNDAFVAMTGYTFDDVKGVERFKLFYGHETDPLAKQYVENKIARNEPFDCEILEYKKNGAPFWANVNGQPIFNQLEGRTHYFIMKVDITEKKKFLEELIHKEEAIRNFASSLDSKLEDQRSSIAREIHDELGQRLVGLKMSLSAMRSSDIQNGDAQGMINDMLVEIDQTIETIRDFALKLRPGILDTLGLIPAIRWLVGEFERSSGLSCQLYVDVNEDKFDKFLSITFFRICQEALTNVQKHAKASSVWVRVEQENNKLALLIDDDGIGIRNEKRKDLLAQGLLGMQERANLIGAIFQISNRNPSGTSIYLAATTQ